MKGFLIALVFACCINLASTAQQKTIHVFVALCDNDNQGIVPVPERLGNGQDPRNNLYWGAAYGIKTFFDKKTADWTLVSTLPSDNPAILERILFKHQSEETYLLADAYDGRQIKNCIEQFLYAANANFPVNVRLDSSNLHFGGRSDLLAYIGHDGLMEFSANVVYQKNQISKDVIMLACYSKMYFSQEIKMAHATPILWTNGLMAPEAYTLKWSIDGWMKGEGGNEIVERAAQAYHQYQNCGMRGARNLFTSGF